MLLKKIFYSLLEFNFFRKFFDSAKGTMSILEISAIWALIYKNSQTPCYGLSTLESTFSKISGKLI